MDDTTIPPRFPSTVEIIGIVAGIVPFVASAASTSVQTVNGAVTSFTYRDPIAIAAGIVAVLCGLFALTLLRKTEPAKKLLRIGLCVALVAGGAYHALHGLGIVGVSLPS